MKITQTVLPGLAIAAGLVTLLASSLEEEDTTVAVPVTVNYTLRTANSGLSRELETRRAIVSGMQLTGTYDANSGDGLTLDRSIVNLLANSSFNLEIVPSGDGSLTGMAMFEITSSLDYGLGRDPDGGAFTILFAGTSTDVNVTSSGVDVMVGGASQTPPLSWSEFVALEDDTDADLDERMASAAYNMLDAVLRAALIVEDVVIDTDTNRETLQNMGLDSGLDVPCDNLSTDQGDPPAASLTWTVDAVGSGQGELGVNDSFEANYRNCRNSQRNRFLDGRVLLSDYFPDRGAGLRTLDVRAELRELYNSETVVEFGTTPTDASPLYDGTLTLNYVEVERTTPTVL